MFVGYLDLFDCEFPISFAYFSVGFFALSILWLVCVIEVLIFMSAT
jgi:hypothetical protein